VSLGGLRGSNFVSGEKVPFWGIFLLTFVRWCVKMPSCLSEDKRIGRSGRINLKNQTSKCKTTIYPLGVKNEKARAPHEIACPSGEKPLSHGVNRLKARRNAEKHAKERLT